MPCETWQQTTTYVQTDSGWLSIRSPAVLNSAPQTLPTTAFPTWALIQFLLTHVRRPPSPLSPLSSIINFPFPTTYKHAYITLFKNKRNETPPTLSSDPISLHFSVPCTEQVIHTIVYTCCLQLLLSSLNPSPSGFPCPSRPLPPQQAPDDLVFLDLTCSAQQQHLTQQSLFSKTLQCVPVAFSPIALVTPPFPSCSVHVSIP